MHTTCPSCGAVNRIPPERAQEQGQCGRCKHDLFNGFPVDLTDTDFSRFVQKNDLPVVVDFWVSWCGPCQMMAPIFKEVAGDMKFSARFAKVNTEQAQQTSAQFGIRSIPTLIVFHQGKEIDRFAGALPAPQLKQWIQQALIKAR
ncbi:thioredoxin TrxC [Bacterioplanoides sp.]|uniref:thioredoxin TrxC n=1 Tax=Bacterioplanoides sp. TaxID=2066072 RepID=UPI003B007392